jgi:hypothetical protein
MFLLLKFSFGVQYNPILWGAKVRIVRPMIEENKKEPEIEKKILSLAEAEAFVEGASYEIGDRPILSSCVDGRYCRGDAEAAPLARPGGDAGDILIALAALRQIQGNNSQEDNADLLRSIAIRAAVAAAGGPEKFCFHTDDHAGAGVARGCGHLKEAEKNPQAYGLAPEDMPAIFEALAELKNAGSAEVVLAGPHLEEAVLVVEDANLGLRRAVDGRQSFVFHKALHRRRLEELARKIFTALPNLGVSQEKLIGILEAVSESQTRETLQRLARGLPVYAVRREDGTLKVEKIGMIDA